MADDGGLLAWWSSEGEFGKNMRARLLLLLSRDSGIGGVIDNGIRRVMAGLIDCSASSEVGMMTKFSDTVLLV